MRRVRLRRSARGGLLLDAVLAVGVLLLGAFVLAHFGITFSEVVGGARQFFSP
jgi:hypothetical protein